MKILLRVILLMCSFVFKLLKKAAKEKQEAAVYHKNVA